MKKVAAVFSLGILWFSNSVSAQSVRSELYFTDPEKLPKYINAEQSEEVFLVFSRDSSTLYFVRQHDPNNEGYKDNEEDQDIWYTRKGKDGQYEQAKDLHQFNNKMNNGVVGMSLDGNSIYILDVYNKRHQHDKGIAVSRRSSSTASWGKPQKVEIPNLKIEGEHWGFYVNPQETIMILSFEGKDTKGQEDLYVILKDKDGKWMTPQSLGDKINTQGFEIAPYLSEDGYTLFWSSDGRAGQGDADIWASFRTDDGWVNWSEPVNMGPKINSPQFDAYFIITANDAWWSSNRDGVSSDIYHARAIKPEPIEDTVKVVVPPPVDTNHVVETKEIPKLPRYIEVKLFFATNSSYIEPSAKRVADSVIAIMKTRPEIVAEVHSHADKRASVEYNTWLTKRRANRVIDYMVLSGIDRKRLTPNWYGKTQLAVECDPCTEEQYKASRRTVIKLSRIE